MKKDEVSNEELVASYQAGDSTALDELLKKNKKFIYKVSKKFYIDRDNAIDYEDLLQEGYIGLVNAADRYSDSEGSSFINYAYYWIYQSMHRFMYPTRNRRDNKEIMISSLNKTIGDGEDEVGNSIGDEDIYPDLVETIAYKEDYEQMMLLIKGNDKVDQRAISIIECRYGFNGNEVQTYSAIGEQLGITGSYVKSIEAQAFRVIRKEWIRNIAVEKRVMKKDRVYDTGKMNDSFFYMLNEEMNGIFHKE